MAGKIDPKDKKLIQQLASDALKKKTAAEQRKRNEETKKSISIALDTAQRRGIAPALERTVPERPVIGNEPLVKPTPTLSSEEKPFYARSNWGDYIEEQEQLAREEAMNKLLGKSSPVNYRPTLTDIVNGASKQAVLEAVRSTRLQKPVAIGFKKELDKRNAEMALERAEAAQRARMAGEMPVSTQEIAPETQEAETDWIDEYRKNTKRINPWQKEMETRLEFAGNDPEAQAAIKAEYDAKVEDLYATHPPSELLSQEVLDWKRSEITKKSIDNGYVNKDKWTLYDTLVMQDRGMTKTEAEMIQREYDEAHRNFWQKAKDEVSEWGTNLYDFTIGNLTGNYVHNLQAEDEKNDAQGVSAGEFAKGLAYNVGGSFNDFLLGVAENYNDATNDMMELLGVETGDKNFFTGLRERNAQNMAAGTADVNQNATWQQRMLFDTASSAINSYAMAYMGQGMGVAANNLMGGGNFAVNPMLTQNKIGNVVRATQMAPFALQSGTEAYDAAEEQGLSGWQKGASALTAMLMSYAANSETYDDYMNRVGLGVADNAEMMARNAAANSMTMSERAYAWLNDTLTGMSAGEGVQEVIESLTLKLNRDLWAGTFTDAEGWQNWSEQAKQDFVGGYLSGAVFNAATLPSYFQSNQMYRRMMNGEVETTPETIAEFIAQAAEDAQSPEGQAAIAQATEQAQNQQSEDVETDTTDPLRAAADAYVAREDAERNGEAQQTSEEHAAPTNSFFESDYFKRRMREDPETMRRVQQRYEAANRSVAGSDFQEDGEKPSTSTVPAFLRRPGFENTNPWTNPYTRPMTNAQTEQSDDSLPSFLRRPGFENTSQRTNPYTQPISANTNPWARPASNAQTEAAQPATETPAAQQPAQTTTTAQEERTQPAQPTTPAQNERTQPEKSKHVDFSDRSNANKITGRSFMSDFQVNYGERLRGGRELSITDVYRDNQGVLVISGQNKKGRTAGGQITTMDVGESRTARLLKAINNHGTAIGYGDNSAVEINECIKNYDSERGTMDEYVRDFSKVYQYAQMGMTPEEIKADYAYNDHLNDKAFDTAYSLGAEKAPEVEFKTQDQQREEAAEAYKQSGQKPENAIEFADDSVFNAGTVRMDYGKSGDLTPVALSTNENGERVVTAIDSKGKTHTEKLGSVQFKDETAQTLFGKFWIDTFDIDQQRGNGGMVDRLTDEALPAYIEGFDAGRVTGEDISDKVAAYAKEFYRVYKAGERGQTLEQLADGDEKILNRIHKVLSDETINKAYKAGQNTPEAQKARRLAEVNAQKTAEANAKAVAAQPAAQTAQESKPVAETKAEEPARNPWARQPADEAGSKDEAKKNTKTEPEQKAETKAQNFRTEHTATVTDEYGDQHTVQVVGVEKVEEDAVILHVVDENGQDDYCLSSDLEFGNDMDELLDYNGISRLSERGVRAYLDGYDSSLASPAEYARAFAGVYERGRAGMDYIQSVANSETAQMFMTSEAARSAFNAGTAIGNFENDVMVGKSARFQKRILDALGKKTGVKFKLTNKDIGANAYYRPSTNEIVVSTKADKGAFIYAAVHEMGHQLKAKGSMEAWAAFSELIQETLEKNGVNIEERVNAAMEQYKGVMDAEGITDEYDRWEYAWEEVVCNSAASFLQDEAVLQDLVSQDRTLMQQVADYIRQFLDDLTQTIQSLGKDMSELNGWKQMEAMKNDHESLQNIYKSLTDALAQTNGQEQQTNDADTKWSLRDTEHMSWREQLRKVQNGTIRRSATLRVTHSGAVMRTFGLDTKPIGMNIRDLNKIMRPPKGSRSAHALPLDVVQALEREIAEPKVAFENADRNCLYVVTGQKDNEGNPVVATVLKDKADPDGAPMHQLISAYGMENPFEYMIDHLPQGSRFYAENKKALLQAMAGAHYTMNAADIHALEERFQQIIPENAEAVNAKSGLKMSLKEDSAGNTLTEEQQTYFANSKVRDEQGRLMPMYHGTPNGNYDKFRSGTYFTPNREYADVYQSPNASSISVKKNADAPSTYQVYLNMEKPFDTRNPKERRLFMNEYYRKWGTGTPLMESGLPDWTDGMDLQEFIEEMGYDYDGLILDEGGVPDDNGGVKSRGLSYVIFDPAQAKTTDNKTPTNDERFRFSMKETVEETRDMLAVHNLTEENMRNAMELGGLAMPSIAVIKAEQGHSQYGTISVIFDKSTIDPEASRDNEIYGADAWTPTFPHVEYEADSNAEKRISDKYYELQSKVGNEEARVLYRYATDLEEELNRNGGVNGIVEKLKDNTDMMQLYLADSGQQRVAPVQKTTVTRQTESQIAMNEAMVEKLGRDVLASFKVPKGENSIEYRRKWLNEHGEAVKKAYAETLSEVLALEDDIVSEILDDPRQLDMKKALREAFQYMQNGAETSKVETDYAATGDAIRKAVDSKAYEKWLNDLFAGVEKRKGIRNGADTYTSTGNRRSFSATHWDVTLDNVVKAMRREDKTGVGTLGRSIEGAAVKKYGSIKDVKADSGRLQKIDQTEYDAMRKDFSDRFSALASEYANGKDQFDAGDALVEYITKNATAEGIYKQMAKDAAFYKPSKSVAEKLAALVDEMKNAPTGYFEAKPRRPVGFDEMAAVIVPDNLSDDVRANLENAGVNVIEYEAGNDEDRKAKMNSEAVDKLKFSLRDTDENVQEAMSAEQKAFEQVKGHRITAAEADKLAGAILKQANSDYDQQKLAAELSRIYDYIERGEDVDWAQVDDEKTALMARVMEKSKALNLEHEEMAKPIRDYFKRVKISLSDSQRSEAANLADGIGSYRRMLFGSVRLANSGTGLETAWSELSELNPELFPADANETDMPALLLQAVDAIKPVYDSGMGMNVEESATWLAGKMDEAYFGLPAVKAAAQSAKTFGDSVVALKNAMKRFEETSWSEYQNALRSIKEAKSDQQKTQKQQELAALRKKYQQWREKDTAARKEREMKAKYRAKTERTVKTLTTWLNKPTDAKHVPAEVDKSIRQMLTSLDFSGKTTKTAAELSDQLNSLADALLNAQEGEDENRTIFLERDQQMIDEIKRVAELIRGNAVHQQREGRGVYDLSGAEMRELSKWLDVVKHVVTKAGTMRGSNLPGESVEQVAAASMEEIRRKTPHKDKKWITKEWNKHFGVDMQDSFAFFERLGNTSNAVFKELRKGFDKMASLVADAEKHTKTILDGADLKHMTGKHAKKQTFQLQSGEVELTKAQIMEMYVLSKREQAQGHLYGGGFRLIGDENARPYTISKAELTAITDTLTKDEKRIADGMQRFLSKECASWGNQASMELLGYRKFGEENYWPISTDSNSRNTTKLEDNYAANISAIKNQGMTKALTEGAKNAIMIGDIFDTYTRHISNMSAYSAYALPLSDFTRWYNSRGVKTEIEHALGKDGLKYINNFLMAVNGSALQAEKSGLSKAAGVLTRNAKIASVGANMRVVVQQPTSYARAAMYISPKYLGEALVMKKPDEDLVNKYCGIAQWKRWGFYETNVGPNLRQLIVGDTSFADKTREVMMKPAAMGDDWTLNHLWNACEMETREVYPELERGSDEYYQQVGARMSEIIDRTQVVDSVFHRSQMMRSKNPMDQMLTNFMAEPTKTYNMLMSAISDYADNRRNKAARNRLARAFTVYGVTGLMTAAAAAVVDAFRDDDEEKEWIEKYTDALKGNAVDNLNPIGLLPGVKDVLSLLQGYESSRLDQQSIQRIVWAAQEIKKYTEGESKLNLYGLTYKTSQALSSLVGIPASNIMRDVNAIIQTVTGYSPTSSPEARKNNTVSRLFAAMKSGTKADVQKLREELLGEKVGMTNKEIDTALATHLANDPKVIEAWTAKQEKRFADANRAHNALTARGFDHEMVDKAIQAYGNSVTPKEKAAKDPNAVLNVVLYSTEEVASAIRIMAGVEQGGSVTEADIRSMISDRVAGSSAADPEKNVMNAIQTELKPGYLEAVKNGDTTKANALGSAMRNVLGTTTEAMNKWVVDSLKGEYVTSAKSNDSRKTTRLMNSLKKYGGVTQATMETWVTDSYRNDLRSDIDAFNVTSAKRAVAKLRSYGVEDKSIQGSLSKYKQQYIDAYRRGDRVTASKIKSTLMGLGLKYADSGNPMYTDATFEKWLQ